MPRRRLAVLIAACVLAAPGAAFAQSAGDEQYQDPFAGEDQPQSTPTPAPAPASGGTQTAQAAPTAAPTAVAAQATTTAPQLPRTGADAGLIALGGAVLLAGGLTLRVRTRPRRPI